MEYLPLNEFLFNIHDTNSLITGGCTEGSRPYCPVNCLFCMCKGDAPGIDCQIPLISKDDFLSGLKFINWDKREILLGDGISKFSAEAFAHPDIYEFIQTLCESFPDHRVTIMTTGVLIRKDKIELLNSLPNLHISLSVNTLDPSLREKIMGVPNTELVRLLCKEIRNLGVQLLDFGSPNVLKEDLSQLSSLRKMEVFQLRRIEHSKFHGPEAVELSKRSIANYPDSVKFLKSHWPKATFWIPYLEYRLDGSDPRFMSELYRSLFEVVSYVSDQFPKKILFVSSESAHNFWARELKNVSNILDVVLVKNQTYGGSVTAAGLMTLADVESAIKGIPSYRYDILMLPSVMFNRSLNDLNGVNAIQFAQRIGTHAMVHRAF